MAGGAASTTTEAFSAAPTLVAPVPERIATATAAVSEGAAVTTGGVPK